MSDVQQRLRVLDGFFRVEHRSGDQGLPPGDEWLAVVRAPDGVTVVTRAEGESGRWVAFYSGETAHDLDVPGMLSALLVPLKSAGISVFVASTYTADVVLVPATQRVEATETLQAAGHLVT